MKVPNPDSERTIVLPWDDAFDTNVLAVARWALLTFDSATLHVTWDIAAGGYYADRDSS